MIDFYCIFAASMIYFFRGDTMPTLGNLLKTYRNELGLSMHQVTILTGITNSRLSKIERDQILCPAIDLKKLAQTYNKSLIDLYIKAEYLSPADISDFQDGFNGVSILDEEERQHIQSEIDFINRKKGL